MTGTAGTPALKCLERERETGPVQASQLKDRWVASSWRYHEAVTVKDRLRKKIEALSEDQAADALRFVESRLDDSGPLDALLGSAPEDDEPITPEEEDSIREARKDRALGRLISAEDARRELLG